jgi:hypothetical protein
MSVLPQELLEQPVVVLEIDAAVDPAIGVDMKRNQHKTYSSH